MCFLYPFLYRTTWWRAPSTEQRRLWADQLIALASNQQHPWSPTMPAGTVDSRSTLLSLLEHYNVPTSAFTVTLEREIRAIDSDYLAVRS